MWLYSKFVYRKFSVHPFVLAIVTIQYCILQVYYLAKSQASISMELSETVRILRSNNVKFSREIDVELEILMLKILSKNLNGRTSRMFSLDYPLIYGVIF